MFSAVIIFIVILSLLVFVHELGHFLTAKKFGMKVEEFGFGFPPRLFGIKKGETLYSLNWIPIGGFVKVKGESGQYKDDSDSFANKPLWQRFVVLVAGVVMNFLFAAILLGIGFGIGIPSLVDQEVPVSATLENEQIRIMSVVEGSPASLAGFESGDVLVSVDDRVFDSAVVARNYLRDSNREISIVIDRKGEVFSKSLEPIYLDELETEGFGVGLVKTAFISYPWHEAILNGFVATGVLTWEILKAFGDLFRNLVINQEVSVDLSGPVGIAVMTGEVAALGIQHLLQFAAILSINLAIINILPFPALDGGRILFVVIEKIRRKAVDQKVEAVVHNLGFLFLMLLVVLVTYRDFLKFGDQILGGIKNVIGL